MNEMEALIKLTDRYSHAVIMLHLSRMTSPIAVKHAGTWRLPSPDHRQSHHHHHHHRKPTPTSPSKQELVVAKILDVPKRFQSDVLQSRTGSSPVANVMRACADFRHSHVMPALHAGEVEAGSAAASGLTRDSGSIKVSMISGCELNIE
ncbi:hypothetical protein ElyMa_003790500 [Elysia marginata]|uniref:Uncharacterized protein n=1 Tax=Elysia marginata TaxID=1093978 RepID=A0AAV4FBH1_9GAST|nr:hypothetical protein ElyMa_003790500 [Elysia marginata]